jgi:hypothetical protein
MGFISKYVNQKNFYFFFINFFLLLLEMVVNCWICHLLCFNERRSIKNLRNAIIIGLKKMKYIIFLIFK